MVAAFALLLGALTLSGSPARAGAEDVFSHLDLVRPGLEKVRAAYGAGNKPLAAAELKAYFRARKEPRGIDDRDSRPAKGGAYDAGAADAVLAREFVFVGKPYTLTHDIDWNADPLHDPEWPIELNRHYTWVDLSLAYWHTYDEKYAEDLAYQLTDWLADSPRPASPQQARYTWRTLECGIRLSGAWPATLFRAIDSDHFTPELLCGMLESIWEQADYLMQFHGSGNWLVTERSGLLTAGIVFPEFHDAASWVTASWDTLAHELTAQIYPDGAQIELTPHYHSAALASFRAAYDVAERNHVAPPPTYRAGLERMYEYLMYVVKPDGFIPMFNDSDHGNMRGWMADGAQRFGRRDMLFVATGGKEGTPPAGPSHAFPWAGQYVMRSGWTGNDVYLAMDAGPYGFGHQHEDKLTVDVWGYGQEMILDPGRFTYAAGKWRNYFLSTVSHSTLLVNGRRQQRGNTPSSTWVTSEPLDNRWVSNADLDFAVGSYDDGYEGVSDVVHVRKVLFVRPSYFVVSDLLLPQPGMDRECEATVQWQLARPGAQLVPGTLAVHSVGQDANIVVCPAAPERLKATLHEGEEDPPAGWIGWSLHAALKTPATMVRYSQTGKPPLVYNTVLLPYRGEQPPQLTVRRLPVTVGEAMLPDAEATALEITGEGWRDVCYLSHSPQRRVVRLGGLTTDAEVAVVRYAGGPQPTKTALIGGAGLGGAVVPEERAPVVDLSVNGIQLKSLRPAAFSLRYGYAAGGEFLFETPPTAPASSAVLRIQNLHFDVPYVYEARAQRDGAWRVVQRGTVLVPEPRAFDFEDGTTQGWEEGRARTVPGWRGSRGALHAEQPATKDASYLVTSHALKLATTDRLRVTLAYRTPMAAGGDYFYVKLTLRADDGEDWSAYFATRPSLDWQPMELGFGAFRNDTYQGANNGKPLTARVRVTRVSVILRKDMTPEPVAPCVELDDFRVED